MVIVKANEFLNYASSYVSILLMIFVFALGEFLNHFIDDLKN
jgi:uncharacterized membrane protein